MIPSAHPDQVTRWTVTITTWGSPTWSPRRFSMFLNLLKLSSDWDWDWGLEYLANTKNWNYLTGTCSWCTCWGASTPSSHCPPAPPWQHWCSEICLFIFLTFNVKTDTIDINSINLPLLPVKFQWTYKFWIPNFTGPQYLLGANGSKNFFMDVLLYDRKDK